MNTLNTTNIQRIIFFFSALVLCVSFYLQYAKGLEPCPLCLMQRICIIAILAASGFAFFDAKFRSIPRFFVLGFALAGLFFALRQIWLMSLPADQIPACLPGLKVLVQYFPWKEVAHALFWGSGDCTEITWTWLGLSLPTWSAIYFLLVALFSAVLFCKQGGCLISKAQS